MNPFYNTQKYWCCALFFLLFQTYSWCQIPSDTRYSMEFTDQTLEEMFQYIENTTHWSIYFKKEALPSRSFSKKYAHTDIPEIINDLLAFSDLDYLNYRNYAIIVLPKNIAEAQYSALHYQRFYDANKYSKQRNILTIGQFEELGIDGYADLRVKVLEQDQKAIRNAKISVYNTNETDQSDQKGIARVSLLAGQYTLKIEHPFYQTVEQIIDIYSSGVIKIYMTK